MESESYQFFVGIDWGNEEHQACIIDAAGKRLEQRRIPNTGTGLTGLVDRLLALTQGRIDRLAIGIETPRGPVVETLLERGGHVFALNPKQLDRFRDRHTVAGAKDDRLDALVLADSLRTDRPLFHRVCLDQAQIIQLRQLTRMYEELGVEQTRLCNQMQAQLLRYWPELLRLCSGSDEPWFWALWELAPTPVQGARLAQVRLAKLLRECRIRRLDTAAVFAVLRAPAVGVAPGVVESAKVAIDFMLPRIRLLQQQRKELTQRMDAILATLAKEPLAEHREHRDVEIICSMTGAGRIVTATVLAEASQPLEKRQYQILRAQAGCAPVTKQTGKQKSGKRSRRDKPPQVLMRYACNSYLREAVYHWARVASQRDEHYKAQYQTLRARGHTHGRALRGVGDRLLEMMFTLLRNGTLYDPSRRRGTRQAAAA